MWWLMESLLHRGPELLARDMRVSSASPLNPVRCNSAAMTQRSELGNGAQGGSVQEACFALQVAPSQIAATVRRPGFRDADGQPDRIGDPFRGA